MAYILEHTTLGFCKWDIFALIVLVAVTVVFAVQQHKLKKRQKELEEQLSGVYADNTFQINEQS
ncbi:MAG: hypothetical protein K2N63_05980 [Lachnospiraceae bacterium]|nr:hypothetical protein [Lachnospiraceae bacterium]